MNKYVRVHFPRATHAVGSATLAAIAASALTGAALMSYAAPGKVQHASQARKPATSSTGNAANGRRLFKKDGCYECHGLEAQGSPTSGPRLGPDPIPLAAMIIYVRHPTGQMPPYTAKVLSDEQLADIHAFLKSLPHPPPVNKIPLLR